MNIYKVLMDRLSWPIFMFLPNCPQSKKKLWSQSRCFHTQNRPWIPSVQVNVALETFLQHILSSTKTECFGEKGLDRACCSWVQKGKIWYNTFWAIMTYHDWFRYKSSLWWFYQSKIHQLLEFTKFHWIQWTFQCLWGLQCGASNHFLPSIR